MIGIPVFQVAAVPRRFAGWIIPGARAQDYFAKAKNEEAL
jgi:hypothetical protein